METAVNLKKYTQADEEKLFAFLQREGEEWQGYWGKEGKEKYKRALINSFCYVLYVGSELVGFVRFRDDDGFGVYIYDLLVDKEFRGHAYGRLLMERVRDDFPSDIVYVMSDVDVYYKKLGYEKEGSIFIVKKH